jgi:SecD/SecF fusion protein
MKHNLTARFAIILIVVGFAGWMSYKGVAQGDLELGIDLKGGSELVFKFAFEKVEDASAKKTLLTEAIRVIQDRVDNYGLKDIMIQPIGDDRFAVQISAKDKKKVDSIKGLITDLGSLEMHITVEPNATDHFAEYWKLYRDRLKKDMRDDVAREIAVSDLKGDDASRYPLGLRWYPLSDTATASYANDRRAQDADGKPQPYVLIQLDDHGITGESLTKVFYGIDDRGIGGGYAVYFSVQKFHQQNMTRLTETDEDGQKYMAIILNGKVDSAPHLKSTLTDSGQITGGFNEESAKALSAILQSGALREPPTLISEQTIAPDLAGSARERGILSTLLGFVIVMSIMIFLYYGPGLLANLALLLNLVLLLGVLTWFGAVLTLPGIAGVILTVGMAVDANILVFERIKEEKAKGRSIAQAITTGYDRAVVTIIDANLTTLITAYFLFQIGSGPVRGFGITLAIGIVASMFTALYVTRTIFEAILKRNRNLQANMRGDFGTPSIPWMSYMRKAVLVSAIAMIGGAVIWEVVPDKVKYDLDFTEGSKLVVWFHEEVPLTDIEKTIADAAKNDPAYLEMSMRAAAEGIGAQVGQDTSKGWELRSQKISSAQQIDAAKSMLRESFRGRLLPGPFESTIRTSESGGSTGTIYFRKPEVQAGLLEAAFEQHNRHTQKLAGATVARSETPTPGAGSVFQLGFEDSAADPRNVALNVRTALDGFDWKAARDHYDTLAKDENRTRTVQDNAKRVLGVLDSFEGTTIDREFFAECDPFPLADRIDPSTAREHRDAAIQAIALSILGIVVYVAFRFRSWSFGIAAVIALIHDVLVCLGLVALANYMGLVEARLNLVTVAAFLTLIGYSINDTIVVFDRIRENRGTGQSRLGEIIDKSVNQTLSRSLRTSITTWIVVVIMLVMNWGAGSALEGFAFSLAIGLIVGTYSSIFIASPTLIFLPWLWERCGSSARGLVRRSVPYIVGSAAVLLVVDSLESRIPWGADFSVELFNDLALSLPIGVLAFYLLQFVRFSARYSAGAADAKTVA